jgi:hypothetical protein
MHSSSKENPPMPAFLPRRAAVLAACAAAALAVPATAFAASTGPAVGPNQFFTGTVLGPITTGSAAKDVIFVDCPAAASTGHPVPGQSVEVDLAATITTPYGFTGSDATSIEADLIWSQANPPITVDEPIANLTAYATPEPIPTDIVVPCSGAGVVSFVPQPSSSTAIAYTLHVGFEGIGD